MCGYIYIYICIGIQVTLLRHVLWYYKNNNVVLLILLKKQRNSITKEENAFYGAHKRITIG